MVLLTHKSTTKCAGRGFARQGAGASWQGKNKDPSRLELASKTPSVCFYTHPPARHRRTRLPPNSKAGLIVFYYKALPTDNIHLPLLQYYLYRVFRGFGGIAGKPGAKAFNVEEHSLIINCSLNNISIPPMAFWFIFGHSKMNNTTPRKSNIPKIILILN